MLIERIRDIRNEIKQLGTEKGENNFVLIYYNDLEYTRNVLQIKKDKLILQKKYLKEKRKIKAKIFDVELENEICI